ncbi:MAG: amidohydrolase [Lachnospiraceae bacterium]|nr:amidohydrolase [Lachnospiraceae bacterium]
MNKTILDWYKRNGDDVKAWAKDIWDHCEIAMEEYHACEVTAEFMKKHGFHVETLNCKFPGEKPNTVVASWGSGHPVIGYIGEYDGLTGMGQDCVPYYSPKEGPGHGCAHNLMSPSCGSAAIACKEAMQAESLPGTVMFFACPAEETVEGKIYMASLGLFDNLDVCMAWHPQPRNLKIRELRQCSLTNMKVEFFGLAAHASSYPERGRSALDACEIMNVGVNYLREHVESTTRMHYSYINGGDKPNIVPSYAALHYFLRTKDLKSNYELLERVKKCAEGASIMTETKYKITINSMGPGCILLNGFNRFLYEAAAKIPQISFSAKDEAFAKELFTNINGREPEEGEDIIFTKIEEPTGNPVYAPSSTDAGVVSRICPTSRLFGWGELNRTPSHSWGYVSCAGSEIGLKSAVYAGIAQAQAGYEIAKDPSVIIPWREDLDQQLKEDGDLKPIKPNTVYSES